jgi:hypothetical protein
MDGICLIACEMKHSNSNHQWLKLISSCVMFVYMPGVPFVVTISGEELIIISFMRGSWSCPWNWLGQPAGFIGMAWAPRQHPAWVYPGWEVGCSKPGEPQIKTSPSVVHNYVLTTGYRHITYGNETHGIAALAQLRANSCVAL